MWKYRTTKEQRVYQALGALSCRKIERVFFGRGKSDQFPVILWKVERMVPCDFVIMIPIVVHVRAILEGLVCFAKTRVEIPGRRTLYCYTPENHTSYIFSEARRQEGRRARPYFNEILRADTDAHFVLVYDDGVRSTCPH